MRSQTTQLEHASDATLVDLLRTEGQLGIAELASALGVTATAVRQRLDRLIRAEIVEKMSVSAASGRSRGRPANAYRLTAKGQRIGGDNFRDLALVLWQEIREVQDSSLRRGLFNRIGASLARLYRGAVEGETVPARLESVAELLRDREIPCSVDRGSVAGNPGRPAELAVLTSHACPYPELAERDRGICAAERRMLEDLVEAPVRLSECRLDGDACCRFTVVAVPENGSASQGNP